MTREECSGCEYFEKRKCEDRIHNGVPICTHKSIVCGLGLWIARIKECPKEKGDEKNEQSFNNPV